MQDILDIQDQGGVMRITLNRPQRLNALNPALSTALRECFQGLYRRKDIRVVILQGAGPSFCAGLDLKEQSPGKEVGASEMMDVQYSIRDIMIAMRRCPQPIISVIQGAASGGGFALALASDIRLATPDARMNASFLRVGLTGCDMGVSYFLPRMVGSSVAAQYLLTGRFLEAQRAHDLGLVSMVAPLEALHQEAQALADDMLRTNPLGLRLTKEALGHSMDMGSLEAVMAMEDRQQILCTQGEDFVEGMRAFLEKRPPHYTGR
jgi:enoyl-CoA hydratase/carnithine racemase